MRIYLVVLHLVIVVLGTVLLAATVGRGARSLLRTSPVYVREEHDQALGHGRVRAFSLWVNHDRIAFIGTLDGATEWLLVESNNHPWGWNFRFEKDLSIKSVLISNGDEMGRRLRASTSPDWITMLDLDADGVPDQRREVGAAGSRDAVMNAVWVWE